MNFIGCILNFGFVVFLMRRGVIERYFRILVGSLFYWLLNIMGSGLDDFRRNNFKEVVLCFNIIYEYLL